MRIHEVGALAELDELSQTEVFVKSMANAGVQQIVSVQKLVMHPVVTAPPSFQPTFVCKTGSEMARNRTNFDKDRQDLS